MNEPTTFEHNGELFEIRVAILDGSYRVKVFKGNEQVSPEYSVNFETHQDFFSQYKEDLVEQLINIARADVQRNIYYKD